jgi:DNA-binding PadR family transcriptional regulator
MDSNGNASMGAGTLYGSLKRMLDAGLVKENDKRIDPEMDDERRIYYQITGVGARARETVSPRVRQSFDQSRLDSRHLMDVSGHSGRPNAVLSGCSKLRLIQKILDPRIVQPARWTIVL